MSFLSIFLEKYLNSLGGLQAKFFSALGTYTYHLSVDNLPIFKTD